MLKNGDFCKIGDIVQYRRETHNQEYLGNYKKEWSNMKVVDRVPDNYSYKGKFRVYTNTVDGFFLEDTLHKYTL